MFHDLVPYLEAKPINSQAFRHHQKIHGRINITQVRNI